MVEATTSPITSALSSAIAATLPTGLQRAQSRVVAGQPQRANLASYTPRAIFNRNFAGVGVLGNVATKPAFRVGQLDTELLDEELLDLLKQQLWGGLKYFRPSLKDSFEPELMAILRLALFKLTIWDNNATYGAALQNLKYVDARVGRMAGFKAPSKTQKVLYGLITVGGRYFYTRLNLWLQARSNPEDESPVTRKLSDILEHLSTLHSFATLVSFLLFLKNGHHRTILDRILRLRLAAPNHMVSREVSFEYLNRQLVWHAFTEFLLFILPVVKIGRWRRWYSRIIRKAKSFGSSGNEDSSILKDRRGELSFLPEKTCAICFKETSADAEGKGPGAGGSTDVTNPYEAIPCGHLYCYICITSKIALEEGEGWECLRCNTLIKKCRPWKGGLGDNFSEDVAAGSSKKVGFESDGGNENGKDESDDEGRQDSIVDEGDIAKLTETLVEENEDDDHHHLQHNEPVFPRARCHSSASAEGSDSEGAGPLGGSYDHLERPPTVAVTRYEEDSEAESERTQRGERRGGASEAPSGAPSVAHSFTRSRSPVRWDTVEDEEEEQGGNLYLQPGKADLGDHGSVYDTAGEED
ncbi:Pex12 amino terminal region-domain-containing protein [Terfezia claveryi]|nr:Pex12 amino terminal region-domain-containing protein [Terfezia claveryi]